MPSGIVVLFGALPVERQAFDPLVSQFGWSVKEIRTVRDLAQVSLDYNLIAVLFDPQYWRVACPSSSTLAKGGVDQKTLDFSLETVCKTTQEMWVISHRSGSSCRNTSSVA